MMFIVSRAGDLVSLYIAMFLVPDWLTEEQRGAVIPVVRLTALVGVPLGILGVVATKFINVMLVRGEEGRIKAFLRDLGWISAALAAALIAGLYLAWEFIAVRLQISDRRLLPMMALMIALACWSPVANTVSQGLKHFYRLSLTRLVGPLARLAVVALLLAPLGLVGYMAGQVAGTLAIVVLLGGPVGRYLRRDIRAAPYRDLLPQMARYGAPLALVALAAALQQTTEAWVIRQRLTADSAGYYTAAMFGVIPMWVAPAMTPFLFPLVSERFERGESTRRMHLQSLAFVAAVGAGIALLLLFCGGWLLSLREKWSADAAYAPYMWRIALVTTLDQVMACHFTHENACSRFAYLRWFVPVALLSSGVLYTLMGWSFVAPFLPDGLWRAVDGAIPANLDFVIGFMLCARALCLGGLLSDVTRAGAGGRGPARAGAGGA
jgi:hypothetical protein